MRQLTNQARSRSSCERKPESEDEPAHDKHGKRGTLALQNCTNNHDTASRRDTPSSSKLISDPRSDGRRADTPQSHDSTHQAENRAARVVKEVVKVGYGLKGVHHRAIVAARGVRHDGGGEEEKVELSAGGGFVPGGRLLGELSDARGLVALARRCRSALLASSSGLLVLPRSRKALAEEVHCGNGGEEQRS